MGGYGVQGRVVRSGGEGQGEVDLNLSSTLKGLERWKAEIHKKGWEEESLQTLLKKVKGKMKVLGGQPDAQVKARMHG